MRIIMREAKNNFDAFLVAEAMESAGANVFSIAHDGMHQLEGALIPCSRFVVFAKYDGPEEARCDEIDRAIGRALYGEETD